MNIFFRIRNIRINAGKVRDISIAREDALSITFDNGETEIFDTYGDAHYDIEKIEKTIVQLIPCTMPVYNVYKHTDGSYSHERVGYFALCADGEIRSLNKANMFFELADESSDFIGYFDEDQLGEFPQAVEGDS